MIKFQGHSPQKNSIGVSRTSPIYFEIRHDSSTIIVMNSINVEINGDIAILNGVFQANFYGIISENTFGYDVFIQHNIFNKGQSINVNISVNLEYFDNYDFKIIIDDSIAPVIMANPKGGIVNSSQSVSLISSKPNTVIYYSIDGFMPTIDSLIYSLPIVINNNTTLKFFGIDEDANKDYVRVELYSFYTSINDNVIPVTSANFASGTYYESKFVTLTSNKPATIYYTLDGSNPTVNSNKDTSPVTIFIDKNTVLKYFAVDEFSNTEIVKSNSYVIYPKENNIVPTNVFVNFPYIKFTADICWDNMMEICEDVVGYNIYRSQLDGFCIQNLISSDVLTSSNVYSKNDSTFIKINKELVTSTFYRDSKLNKLVLKENVSDQFKNYTLTDANTNFEGEIVDANKWQAIDNDRLFSQSNGINFIDVYGYRESCFQSLFKMKGNFDIETEYDLFGWPLTDSIHFSEISFIVAFNEFSYIKLSKLRKEAIDYYVSYLYIDSQEVSKVEVLNSFKNGKIKIVRVSSNVSTYYYDGISWILLDSYISFSNDDLQVKFNSQSCDKGINVKFLYFHVNSGLSYLPFITNERGEYSFCVKHVPIVTDRTNKLYTDQVFDVDVEIDGVKAIVKSVDGLAGKIILKTNREFDYVKNVWIEPIVPKINSIITVTYMYEVNKLKMNLGSFPFYKVTSVLSDGSETRLQWCPSVELGRDTLDYMYQEAVRRNNWLLDNAGERVLLFIRKTTGEKCECYKRNERTHSQPQVGSCKKCYGSAFVGGYEGPFEIRISPFESEQKIRLTERGSKFENVEKTWTTISPTISQRDFIVRRNSTIYAIGPVSAPEVRGVVTQQHFSVESVDTTDVRYNFLMSLNLFNYKDNIGLRKSNLHYTDEPIIINGESIADDKLRTNKGPNLDSPKNRNLNFENMIF